MNSYTWIQCLKSWIHSHEFIYFWIHSYEFIYMNSMPNYTLNLILWIHILPNSWLWIQGYEFIIEFFREPSPGRGVMGHLADRVCTMGRHEWVSQQRDLTRDAVGNHDYSRQWRSESLSYILVVDADRADSERSERHYYNKNESQYRVGPHAPRQGRHQERGPNRVRLHLNHWPIWIHIWIQKYMNS